MIYSRNKRVWRKIPMSWHLLHHELPASAPLACHCLFHLYYALEWKPVPQWLPGLSLSQRQIAQDQPLCWEENL